MQEQYGIETGNDNLMLQPGSPISARVSLNRFGGVLLIPESSSDSIGLYDPYDGTFLRNLCEIPKIYGTSYTPSNAVQGPDGNIYLSDQVQDAVFMIDTAGNYLGVYADATDGLNNIRGIAFRGNHLFVTNGTGTVSTMEFSGPHTFVRYFINDGSDPFDIYFLPDGRALLSDIAGTTDNVRLYDTNGVYIRNIFSINFPEQIQADPILPGDFLVAGFSTNNIQDFDTTGTVYKTWPLSGARGVYRLGNGNVLGTYGSGIVEIDSGTGAIIQTEHGGSGRFIELYTSASPTPTCTINVNTQGSGTITPSGMVLVPVGENKSFTIASNIGYHLDSLIVDDVNHGSDSTSFLFESVTENHTMTGYFSINTYTITASATSGGTISPIGDVIVEYGVDTTFYISANSGNILDSVLVDGISVGAVTTYPFNDVDADHTIHAIFTITATPGWMQRESIPVSEVPKAIKDGGALIGIPAFGKDPATLYAFLGTKTNRFLKYTAVSGWSYSQPESILFGHKYKPSTGMDSVKFNKKYPGKGAALCFDGDHTIYAVKGNGTWEFFAFDLNTGLWTPKAYVTSQKALKGGTSLCWYVGKVYMLAGGQKKDDPNNFFSYDPLTDAWTTLTGVTVGINTKPWKDGSSINVINDLIYAVKGGDKYNAFHIYDPNTNLWTEKEAIPNGDSLDHKWKKKLLVKDGAIATTDGDVLYAMKGGQTTALWRYTPNAVPPDTGLWENLDPIPIEKIDKKHRPKTGAAMTYVDGKVWLLTGNKQPDFWWFVPGAEKAKVHSPQTTVSEANLKVCPTLSVTPNPFSKLTTIRYNVASSGKVSLKLYTSTGRLISTLIDESKPAGFYSLKIGN